MTTDEARNAEHEVVGWQKQKKQNQTKRVRNPETAEATSEDSRSDGKGGGSLDETTSKSHHKRE